jgi:hypothetical protein
VHTFDIQIVHGPLILQLEWGPNRTLRSRAYTPCWRLSWWEGASIGILFSQRATPSVKRVPCHLQRDDAAIIYKIFIPGNLQALHAATRS